MKSHTNYFSDGVLYKIGSPFPAVSFENTALSSIRCEGQLALRRQIPSPGERLQTHGLEAEY
jgi:hypothetical protein